MNKMRIPFSRVDCSGEELTEVREVLDSGWLTTGPKTAEFEERFRKLVGAKHACAVNSCTSALHLALEALGVGPGDLVMVPTWTFTATAEVIRYMGADPVFLDVDYGTCALTAEGVEKGIRENPNAKYLIVVHFGGQAAPMGARAGDGILSICRRHGVRVVEDAAHAFPSRENGIVVGNLGDVTCFSFYANKTITTGEGGMLVTNDDVVADRAKLMRLHGIDRDVWNRFTSDTPRWEYDVCAPGYKYNMPDLNAAVGLAQLDRAEEMRSARQACAQFYLEKLAGVTYLDLPEVKVEMGEHAWHLFPVVIKKRSKINRNQLMELLAIDGIGTSVHYKPLHRMSYYRERYALENSNYPVSEKLWNGIFSLPIFSSLKEEEQEYVVSRVRHHLEVGGI